MQQTEKNIFNYAFKLLESIITSVDRKDKGLIIRLDSVKVFKYSGKIGLGIEETGFSSAEVVFVQYVSDTFPPFVFVFSNQFR